MARPDSSTQDDALLAAVYDAPGDDAPRLVYADSLLERGDARGELIQLQREVARIDEDDERWHRLKHRERALLKKHAEAWTSDLRALGTSLSFEFQRGFVELARGRAEDLVSAGDELLAKAPLLRRLDAHCALDTVKKLTGSSVFAHADAVRLGSWRRRIDLSSFSKLAGPLPLRRLDLDEVALVRADIEAVVSCSALPCLRELEINRCVLGKNSPEPLEALDAQLDRFSLVSGKHPEALVRALSRGRAFARLKALVLCNNPIGDEGLRELVRARRLQELDELDLRSNELSKRAVANLVSEVLPPRGLRRLLHGGNELDDGTAIQISKWPGASELVKLDLGSAEIGDEGVLALAASPFLGKLRSLVLTQCRVKPSTEARLLESPHLARSRLYVGTRFLKRG